MTVDVTETELSRDLGLFAVVTTAAGTMIGAGIFILPGLAAEQAGPAASLSFLVAGVIAGISTLSAAELATAMPRAGGPYFFVSRAMGPAFGTVVGLGAWLALVLKGSFALVGLGQYVHHFSATPVLATAVAGGLLLTAVNWMGAKFSGLLQNVIVVVLLAILGVFIGRGFFAVDRELLTPFVQFGAEGVWAATGLVFISYLGVVKAAAIAEEVKDPGRNLPVGLLTSVILVTCLYIAVMLVVTGVLPIEGGGGGIPGIAEREAPLADAGAIFMGALGGALMGVSGILATASTGNAAILSSARLPFAMARDGLMSPGLSRTDDRFGTPARAIWLTGGLMLALVLLFDVEALAKLGGTFGILVFSLLNVAVLLLRRARPEWYDPPFRAPLYPGLQIAGTLAALSLIPQMGTFSQVGAGLFVVSGGLWYLWQRRRGEAVSPDYGLPEQLRRVVHQQSLEAKEEAKFVRDRERRRRGPSGRILVELESGRPYRSLLTVAAGLARQAGAGIEVVLLREIPDQVPLSELDEPLDAAWTADIGELLEDKDIDVEVHRVVTHDRDRALLARATGEIRTILLGWNEPLQVHRLRDSHVDRLMQDSPVPVLVLRQAQADGDFDRIVVAVGGGPYEQSEVEAAGAVATASGARLTFLKVLPTDASGERRSNAEEYLKGLGDLVQAPTEARVVLGDDVADTLVEESRDSDLLVLGASPGGRVGRAVLGRRSDRIASRSFVPVLIVKEPGKARRGPSSLLWRLFQER